MTLFHPPASRLRHHGGAHPRRRSHADADAGISDDRAAARIRPRARRCASRRSRATTRAVPPGIGTTSPSASTRARISTRRSTGSPGAICRTTRPTASRLENFVASACVVDCSREAAADADYLLSVAKLRAFEERAWPHPAALLGADAHRLVEKQQRSGGLPELRRDRPAHAGARCRGRALPGRGARRHRLRHRDDRHGCRAGRASAARPIRATR